MYEKSYEINVDVVDLAYPLQIEREIRLRSRLVSVCGKKAMRMAFTIEGRKNGRRGSACEFIDLPEGALLPDGDPVYRKMLEAFCNLWDREREDKNTEFLHFRIMLMDYDVVDPYKDVFTIKAKGEYETPADKLEKVRDSKKVNKKFFSSFGEASLYESYLRAEKGVTIHKISNANSGGFILEWVEV
jgi:hypothetical protein